MNQHIVSKFFVLLATVLLMSCSRQKAPVEINGEADIVGKTIAVPAGSIYEIDLSKRSDVHILRYTTLSDMIAALKSGKCDAFMADEISMTPADKRRQGIKVAFTAEQKFDIAFTLQLDDEVTRLSFNEFLAEARKNGLYEEMRHRWFDTEDPDTVQMPEIKMATSGKPFRYACCFSVSPMSIIEGDQWSGFEVEILKRYAAYIDRPIEFKIYDYAAALAALKTGQADMMGGNLFVTEERAKSVLFTDPYYGSSPAYFVLDEQSQTSSNWWTALKDSVYKNLIYKERWRFITDGLWETLVISFCSLILGTLLAALLCWIRMSRYRWLSAFAGAYINLMRGIPLLVLLMIMFYVVLSSSGLNATTVAVISFSMVFAAYVSEMFRMAILSVGKGQKEAGVALGFTPLQTFFYIILPQAAQSVMPVYKGEAVSLFKNTSIVGYIAIQDLTKASDLIRARTFDAFFPLITITVIYFILAWMLGKLLEIIVKPRKS